MKKRRTDLNPTPNITSKNGLLAALPRGDYLRLAPHLEPVTLLQNEILYKCGGPIRHVFFPEKGLVSVLSVLSGEDSLELVVVGSTGLLGVPLALGARTHTEQAVVEISGTAARMDANFFLSQFTRGGEFQRVILNYTRFLLFSVSRYATCNYFHLLQARLARLFLTVHDQVGPREFPMTHKYMSKVLGAARSEVAKTAANFRHRGLIAYQRNKIRIVNRRGLESEACECYRVNKKEFGRLFLR
jgi:CRP-like cAMP-binding protein